MSEVYFYDNLQNLDVNHLRFYYNGKPIWCNMFCEPCKLPSRKQRITLSRGILSNGNKSANSSPNLSKDRLSLLHLQLFCLWAQILYCTVVNVVDLLPFGGLGGGVC